MLALQLFSVIGYGIMAYQDIRDREVLWVLFPMLGTCLALTFGLQVGLSLFALTILINLVLTSCVIFLLWTVTRFLFRKPFLNVSFGLGDLLLLYMIALGFPTMTFVHLLVGSLLFSLVAFFLMKVLLRTETVPLAGLMGLFLMAMTLLSLIPGSPSLYTY